MSMEKKSKRQERREKMRTQAQRSRLITIGLIVLGAAFLVFAVVAPQLRTPDAVVTSAPANLPNPNGATLGDPNAPVTIDVFEDFQCPACKSFGEQIEPLIIQYLVQPGKAKYVFHNYPFIDGDTVNSSGESDMAANASMCANEQGKFWEMKSTIYANWQGENKGFLTSNSLKAMAEAIGLDMNQYKDCFRPNKFEKEIQADFDLGKKMGVSGTPSVFVNGAKAGQPGYIPTYQEIAEAVDAAYNATK